MKRFTRLLMALAATTALTCAAAAHAELVATPLPGDSRLVQFEYDADNTFLLLARPKLVTHIEFGRDEQIVTVAGGDTKNWELTPTSNLRNLFVKPVSEQLETSMTVITNKRSYQFVLRSTGPGAKWYQRVTWRYGETILLDLKAAEEKAVEEHKAVAAVERARDAQTLGVGVDPASLRFGYQLTGEANFRPVSVFDDGKFTWIRIPAGSQELPALFATGTAGELMLVNYVVKGDYLVAQRVLEAGLLKLGKQEVRFARGEAPKRGFFKFGEN